MGKGLFLGLTTIDILYGVGTHPTPNEKLKAEWQLTYAGGPVANAAVAFSALGNKSHLCSGLGNHPATDLATRDLAEYGVRFHDCTAQPDGHPVLSSILINSMTGDRCVIYSNTDERSLLEEIDYGMYLSDCEILLLDGYYLSQAVILAKSARERGVKVVFDGGSWKNGLDDLLPSVDYAICSENFVPPGCTDVESVFDYLLRYEMTGCAVSRGSNSIVAYECGRKYFIEVAEVNATDTLGAGDILHGAFCNYILSHSFKNSLQRAAAVASESCRYYGTRQWIKYHKKKR
jgi:sugar/nucleoside kinase (ribokinase family)